MLSKCHITLFFGRGVFHCSLYKLNKETSSTPQIEIQSQVANNTKHTRQMNMTNIDKRTYYYLLVDKIRE